MARRLVHVNDTFVWNTATICRYDILAFGSMIGCLIAVYNILHNIAVHNSKPFVKILSLNTISYHDINTGIRILQSNKC